MISVSLTHQKNAEVGSGVESVRSGVELEERHHHKDETVRGEAARENLQILRNFQLFQADSESYLIEISLQQELFEHVYEFL